MKKNKKKNNKVWLDGGIGFGFQQFKTWFLKQCLAYLVWIRRILQGENELKEKKIKYIINKMKLQKENIKLFQKVQISFRYWPESLRDVSGTNEYGVWGLTVDKCYQAHEINTGLLFFNQGLLFSASY